MLILSLIYLYFLINKYKYKYKYKQILPVKSITINDMDLINKSHWSKKTTKEKVCVVSQISTGVLMLVVIILMILTYTSGMQLYFEDNKFGYVMSLIVMAVVIINVYMACEK